MIATVINAV